MPIIVLILLLLLSPFCHAENINPATDLTYLGCFKIDDLGWGGGEALSVNPAGNDGAGSLLIGKNGEWGQDDAQEDAAYLKIAEYAIPELSLTQGGAVSASIITALTDITSIATHTANALGNIYYHTSRSRIYWSGYLYYNTSNAEVATLGWSSTNLASPNPTGMWYVGAVDSTGPNVNKTGKYITFAPDTWAASYTGGKPLISGRTRGGGNYASHGPTLYAVDPDDEGNPPADGTRLPYVKMLEYSTTGFPSDFGTTYTTPITGNNYPHWSTHDRFRGAAWVTAGTKQALVLSGRKASEKYCYGATCPQPSCGSVQEGFNVYTMDDGTPAYSHRLAWYSVDDLAAVAQANGIGADLVQPYSEYTPSDFWTESPCLGYIQDASNGLGGVAYDANRQRLYVVELSAYSAAGTPKQVVHVYEILSGQANRRASGGGTIAGSIH
jgi:hypothetical protein